jgi:hypothetical protein
MARPTKFNAAIAARTLDVLSSGCGRDCAARIAGISPRTLANWLARGRAGDPAFASFAERVDAAQEKYRRLRVGMTHLREAARRREHYPIYKAQRVAWWRARLGEEAFWQASSGGCETTVVTRRRIDSRRELRREAIRDRSTRSHDEPVDIGPDEPRPIAMTGPGRFASTHTRTRLANVTIWAIRSLGTTTAASGACTRARPPPRRAAPLPASPRTGGTAPGSR